jgi:monoamine oxidase
VWSPQPGRPEGIAFQPPLPLADYSIRHGPSVKFFGRFADQFWEQILQPSGNALAPAMLSNQLGSVWNGSDKQGTAAPFVLTDYSGGGLVQASATEYKNKMDKHYPGYKAKVTATHFQNWPTEPWIKTGYSVPARNQVTTVAMKLSTTPFMGRLFFAGEHTYVPFFGYMEGALQSGARAGREIVATVCGSAV